MAKKGRKPKKKSAISIGKETEAEYEQKMINEQGYLTFRPPKGSRWEANKDIFNLFDLLGVKADGMKLAQVKTNEDGGAIKLIQKWVNENIGYLPPNLTIEVAIKKKATKRKPIRWVITQIVPIIQEV